MKDVALWTETRASRTDSSAVIISLMADLSSASTAAAGGGGRFGRQSEA